MLLKKFFATLTAAIVLTSTCAASKSEVIDVEISVPEVKFHQDVTFAQYFTWPQNRLKMDIYCPTVKEKSPAVIFVPGGWWITSPKDAGAQLCLRLAESGFVVASIEYRHLVESNYIDMIGDVKAAVRYLRAHADEFNIDKNKIAVMGASAGGYLSTMVGVTGGVEKFDFGENLNQSSEVQAVIDIFGPSDLTKIAADYSKEMQKLYNSPSGAVALLANGVTVYKNNKGGSLRETPETAKDSNPLTHINKNTPLFLIMHGNADKTVSPSQSKILYDELTKNGIDAEYYVINGVGHDFKYFFQPKTFNLIVDFLNKVFND